MGILQEKSDGIERIWYHSGKTLNNCLANKVYLLWIVAVKTLFQWLHMKKLF